MILYRMYNNKGTLIYVGITDNLIRRRAQHARRHWFSEICWTHTEVFSTERLARDAERLAIETENPQENVHLRLTPKPGSKHLGIRHDELYSQMLKQGLSTNAQLAERMGADPASISRILRGIQEPGAAFVASMARALNTNLDDLFEIIINDDQTGHAA